MRKYIALLIVFLCLSLVLTAQTPTDGTAMEAHGKIYVVMAVCLTVLIGLISYMVMIDRKVSALEKKKD
jgi:drug/metabolite transporter superfamily protein YnfA